MGVSREVFAIYGYKGDYFAFEREENLYYDDEEARSKFKNIIDIEYKRDIVNELILISDGMSGDYSYFGILVFKSGDDRFDDDTDVNFTVDDKYMKLLKRKLNKVVKEFEINTEGLTPELHVFTHYS